MKSKEEKDRERLAKEAAWVAEDSAINAQVRGETAIVPQGGSHTVTESSLSAGFANARYLGGFAHIPQTIVGNLWANTDLIGLGAGGSRWLMSAPWSTVESIEVTDLQAAKSRAGWVIAFGVLGLAAKGTKNQTALILRLQGEHGTGHFLIDNTQPFTVRARLAPIMQAVGVRFADESPAEVPIPSAPQVDVADQIRKFAALREDGLITDEEFAVQKARLLSE